jgi:hypothetical protein
MYSRVAVTEWDDEYPQQPRDKEIAELLKRTFVTFDDRVIRETVEDLEKLEGGFDAQTPTQILDYLRRKGRGQSGGEPDRQRRGRRRNSAGRSAWRWLARRRETEAGREPEFRAWLRSVLEMLGP